MIAPLIVSVAGTVLSREERAFLREVRPLGVILFARNIADGEQVRRLAHDAREAAGGGFVLVDQEGGRVQRVRPPLAMRYPPAATLGALHARDAAAGRRAAFLCGRLLAGDLVPLGIDMPCLPVADVRAPSGHDVIGDRAYGDTPEVVAVLARAVAEGVLAAGGLPVVKHVPGHGRAGVDSHVALPVVEVSREVLADDFAPFAALADMPVAMTAHVVYRALDPTRPATLSPAVLAVVREVIGFDGLLMTDDISMRALSADVVGNAAAALAAGCDCVLHCNGRLGEMRRIAEALPAMAPAAARRLAAARARLAAPAPDDLAALREEFLALTRERA